MIRTHELLAQLGAGRLNRIRVDLLRLRHVDGDLVVAERIAHGQAEVDLTLGVEHEPRLEIEKAVGVQPSIGRGAIGSGTACSVIVS